MILQTSELLSSSLISSSSYSYYFNIHHTHNPFFYRLSSPSSLHHIYSDLNDFESSAMGITGLTTTSSSKSIKALTKCLYELCDALRKAGFTIVEMFSGFDRNGSGVIIYIMIHTMIIMIIIMGIIMNEAID